MSLGCNQARLSRYRHGAFSPRFRHSKGTPVSKALANFSSEHVACQTMIELHLVDSIGVVGRIAERLCANDRRGIAVHASFQSIALPIQCPQSYDYRQHAPDRARLPYCGCGPNRSCCYSVRAADRRTHTNPLVVETSSHSSESCDTTCAGALANIQDNDTLDAVADWDDSRLLDSCKNYTPPPVSSQVFSFVRD